VPVFVTNEPSGSVFVLAAGRKYFLISTQLQMSALAIKKGAVKNYTLLSSIHLSKTGN
jgi:hypothetical protein